MNWFKHLSIGNKLALISLLLSVAGICVAIFEFKVGNTQNQAPVVISIEQPKTETSGKNSPIINNVDGNVEMDFK